MELPRRLIHASEAAWAVVASRRAGAAMAAALRICDVRIACVVCEASEL